MTNWNDSLLIGVELIDKEHRKLIDAIDKLMDACNHGKDRDEIGHTLHFINNYAREHIKVEENLQEKYAYPGISAHKRLHAQFAMSLSSLVHEFDETGPNVTMTAKFNKTLVEWGIHHIAVEDKKVGEHVRNSGAK